MTETYSWSDNLSWVRGNHTMRAGTTILTQQASREDTGSARGKVTFQTFSDFLLGLTAADNLSPAGRSNVQSIQTAFAGNTSFPPRIRTVLSATCGPRC